MAKRRYTLSEVADECERQAEHSIGPFQLSNVNAHFNEMTFLHRALSGIPRHFPERLRAELIEDMYGLPPQDVRLGEELSIVPPRDVIRVLGPPTGVCFTCRRELSKRTSCNISIVTVDGVVQGRKVSLRCRTCLTVYQYSRYGDSKIGFRFYDKERDFVEASDVLHVSRRLCQFQASLANHAWVSFEGFTLAINDTFLRSQTGTAVDRRSFSSAFYWFEVENELRRIKSIDFRFSGHGTVFDDALPLIEDRRQSSAYEHSCTEACVRKGCGKMVVFDGIWKLNFTHCMMVCKNVVKGIPMLNLPDVCTSEPATGAAFCSRHVELVQEYNSSRSEADKVPTKLRDFLRFCGVSFEGGSDRPKEDHCVIEEKVANVIKNSGLDCSTGDSVIDTHAGRDIIQENVSSVQSILNDSVDSDEQLTQCTKDTGERKPMHQRSRGHLAAVSPGGHILMFSPIYRSESPSQVLLFMLLVLWNCLKGVNSATWSGFWLAYDNMCHIVNLKATKVLLSSDNVFAGMWGACRKMIDGLHIRNHKMQYCQEELHPSRFDQMYPELKEHRNTMVAEQTFVWLGRFKKIVVSMPKRRHLFYIHRMVLRRNDYTTACHESGVKIVLPKVTNQYTT